jgi:surface protein
MGTSFSAIDKSNVGVPRGKRVVLKELKRVAKRKHHGDDSELEEFSTNIATNSQDSDDEIIETSLTDQELRTAVFLWFSNRQEAMEVYGHISSWDTSLVTDMNRLFQDKTAFNEDISDWYVESVTDMSFMFYNASSFNQPIGQWDVENVTNMSNMFSAATNFNQPLSQWNVQRVSNMSHMFSIASNFIQPVEQWNVANVTNMSRMFFGATSFNQPLGRWNIHSVTDLSHMFERALSFNQPLDKWEVDHVMDMSNMFSEASSFNQSLDRWNIHNDANTTRMFFGASSYNNARMKPIREKYLSLNVTELLTLAEVGDIYALRLIFDSFLDDPLIFQTWKEDEIKRFWNLNNSSTHRLLSSSTNDDNTSLSSYQHACFICDVEKVLGVTSTHIHRNRLSLNMTKPIDKGAEGGVFKGTLQLPTTGDLVNIVAKQYHITPKTDILVNEEMQKLMFLSHCKFCPTCFGHSVDTMTSYACIIVEHACYGDLHSVLDCMRHQFKSTILIPFQIEMDVYDC